MRAVEENPALEVRELPEATPVADNPDTRIFAVSNFSPDDERWEPQQPQDAPSLAEHLEAQLAERHLSPTDRLIATYIIGNIDDNGYLTRQPRLIADDIAVEGIADVSTADVSRVLAIICELDPPGVGASDLRECLLLQIERHPDLEHSAPLMDARTIVRDHYDLFSRMQTEKLASATRLSPERIRLAFEAIRTLNPKPGAAATPAGTSESANIVRPDYIVEREGDRLTVSLPGNLPSLALSESFNIPSGPRSTPREKEAARMAAPYRDEALTLIRALEMRTATMMAVMKAIVARQPEYFRTDDPLTLRPMLLKDIAADTGYDISTVSRATSGKYVATPAGIFPLRMFFNERATEDSDATSREIMAALREIVDSEPHNSPMSDEALTEELTRRGYPVARRTVAKYREVMGIPSSRLRKRI